MRKTLWLWIGLWFHTSILYAQLDTIHWLPPMHGREDIGAQYLYLSTPEQQPFEVNVRNGQGTLVVKATISNSQPFRYDLGSFSINSNVHVPEDSLHVVLHSKGLVIDGAKRFYAYYRTHAASQRHAGDLTCKGRSALGRIFRIGQLIQGGEAGGRSNFMGIMATEDSTLVRLSGYVPMTGFRILRGDQIVANKVEITLHKGQSVVFAQYLNRGQPSMGLMGSLVESSKSVVINCGSWLGAPVPTMANDIGIDQIAPFERMGKEYILTKGNGGPNLERAIIIAHKNNTRVWLNGGTTAVATLNAGEYYLVETNQYASGNNLYIRTSEPVFVYQTTGGVPSGGDEPRTAGLIFVPPISCGIPNLVDNIYQPNSIGNMTFEGGLMMVAMRDSMVTLRIDGNVVPLGFPDPVTGNPDFVTYRNLNLFSQSITPTTLSVVAQGAVQVAVYGRNEPASFAAFYSGFSRVTEPEVNLKVVGNGICPDTLVVDGRFDQVQWVYEDSVIVQGPQRQLPIFAPGRYRAVGYLGRCRRTDFATDSLVVNFKVPQAPYTPQNPSCFGYTDGRIVFGTPNGGVPPYSYSINDGRTYVSNPDQMNLSAGLYKLRVKDSRGCFDKPSTVRLTQPDSFRVDLRPVSMPDPLKPFTPFSLEAVPNRAVRTVRWRPVGTSECANCLRQSFELEKNGHIIVQVEDEKGCRTFDTLLVVVEPNVFAPNVFQPDAIGSNGFFSLFTPEPVPIRQISIFDRWGDLVFEGKDIMTNDVNRGWNGMQGNSLAPSGIYVFQAKLELSSGNVRVVSGEVLLMR
jgi:gliding motility-associated-like protein